MTMMMAATTRIKGADNNDDDIDVDHRGWVLMVLAGG